MMHMNRFQLSDKLSKSGPIKKVEFIQDKCRGKNVLDLGCIRHSADYAINDPDWLHQKIKAVAEKVIGVDYLLDDVMKLRDMGHDIVFGDVTKPLDIKEKFDVIVAGDLIEHLLNIEAFFLNCSRLLMENGILIVTTPNPFFSGEYHYVSFKKQYLVNPEHTCWIDPQVMLQLSERSGFFMDEIYFIDSRWKLKDLILESKEHEYNIIKGIWKNNNLNFKIKRKIASILFQLFYGPLKLLTGAESPLVRYSDYLAVLKVNVLDGR